MGWEGWYLFSDVLKMSYKFVECGKTYIKKYEEKYFLYVREGDEKIQINLSWRGKKREKTDNPVLLYPIFAYLLYLISVIV